MRHRSQISMTCRSEKLGTKRWNPGWRWRQGSLPTLMVACAPQQEAGETRTATYRVAARDQWTTIDLSYDLWVALSLLIFFHALDHYNVSQIIVGILVVNTSTSLYSVSVSCLSLNQTVRRSSNVNLYHTNSLQLLDITLATSIGSY